MQSLTKQSMGMIIMASLGPYVYGPCVKMIWEGWVTIWNSYGATFLQISSYGKYMGRKAHVAHCMGELYGQNAYINL